MYTCIYIHIVYRLFNNCLSPSTFAALQFLPQGCDVAVIAMETVPFERVLGKKVESSRAGKLKNCEQVILTGTPLRCAEISTPPYRSLEQFIMTLAV